MMQVSNPTYSAEQSNSPCKCDSHTQHKVFRFKFANPSASRADIASALHMTESNVKKTLQRLRKLDLSRRCPECFKDELIQNVCHFCGCEESNASMYGDGSFNQMFPTNSLHAGNLLGSEVAYKGIGFENHWVILKRRVDAGIEDSLLRGVKSDVMNELKRGYYRSEAITDYAGRCCVWEVVNFRRGLPKLAASKKVREQLVERVMKRLELKYGEFKRTPSEEGGRGDAPAPQVVQGGTET